jgi:Response regulator containing a CheY-like receiver domain and an HTH DNA-binding domain
MQEQLSSLLYQENLINLFKYMKKVLLIVDDETLVSSVLMAQFNQDEVEIILTNNGEVGLKTALEHHPDLILLDLVMPKMDGMTMLSKLREDKWGKQAKVIILSNIVDADKVDESKNHGVAEYYVKSNLDAIALAEKIKEVLKS